MASHKQKNRVEPLADPVPSNSEREEALREQLLKDTTDELVKKQISNSENFDKSVLTLSASALGLSLTFIKDIVPLARADWRWLLVLSWCLFGLAVVATMTSFMTSQSAIAHQLAAAERYYRNRDESALNESLASKWTVRLNKVSGLTFIAGIVLTVFFVVLNLPAMSSTQKPTPPAPIQPVPQPANESQVMSIKAGQVVNQIRPVPPPKKGN